MLESIDNRSQHSRIQIQSELLQKKKTVEAVFCNIQPVCLIAKNSVKHKEKRNEPHKMKNNIKMK